MIIGICGFIGTGKDTIGNILCIERNYIQLSFANILKEIISKLFCWDLEMIQGLTKESRIWREEIDVKWSKILGYDVTPRLMLERGGTQACRNVFGENIFVGHLRMTIDKLIEEKKNIVITDCRFNNEIELIKSYKNHKIIHVHNNLPSWYHSYKSGIEVKEILDLHISKYEWIRNEFDYEISNNDSIDKLKDKILDLF
jgi:hypothetical protein